MMQHEGSTFLDFLQRMASRRGRTGRLVNADSSTTAITESAAAKPKAGAAPTHPTSTPPKAGPLAKRNRAGQFDPCVGRWQQAGDTSDGTNAGAATL